MSSRDLLRDLPGVAVVVKDGTTREIRDSLAKEARFDCQTCRADVEGKLYRAGVGMLAIEDRTAPRLCLNVSILSSYSYAVSLKVIQGDPPGTKWSHGVQLGTGPVSDALDHVKKLVGKFVEDWLAVNGTA